MVGQTPWSAAGPLAGLLPFHETDSSTGQRVQGTRAGDWPFAEQFLAS